MKNKYILLALLPILSAGNIFCAQAVNINVASALIDAWRAMQNQNVQGVPSIKDTLQELVAFAAENDIQETAAISHINRIKFALETSKRTHYNGTFMSNAYWFFDIEPNNAVTDINNDMKEIKDALEAINDKKWRKFNTDTSRMLSITANRTMYVAGGALLGVCAFYCYVNRADINKFSFWKSHMPSFNSISTATTNAGNQIAQATISAANTAVPVVQNAITQTALQSSILADVAVSTLKSAVQEIDSLDYFLNQPATLQAAASCATTQITSVAAPIIEQAAATPGIFASIYTVIYNNKIKIGAGAATAAIAGTEVATNGGVSNFFSNTVRQARRMVGL